MAERLVLSPIRLGAPRIGLRCDAGAKSGTGHLIRCLALADELTAQGAQVLVLGDIGEVDWAEAEVTRRGLPRWPGPHTPDECVRLARQLDLDAMVIDSYEVDPRCAGALRDAGIRVLAIVDTDTRGQIADIYLDQNLGAEDLVVDLPPGAVRLAGLSYVLLRGAVRRLRPVVPRVSVGTGEPPAVLCFFGGSDAFDAAPTMTRLLLATGVPLAATVVAARASIKRDLEALPVGAGQSVKVISPTSDLPELVVAADLVIGASGTSTWELLCLGAPSALIWVAENQLIGFNQVVSRGLVAGLGGLAELAAGGSAAEDAVRTLCNLLTTVTLRDRLATKAWEEIDGHGCSRVAGSLLGLVSGLMGTVQEEHPSFTRWR